MQQYGIAVKESRGCLSYLPAGRTTFIRAKHLGDKFDKAAVLATLQANAERKPKAQFKQDTIGKLIDIQSRMTEGKGIGYKRWLTKHNLKVMAQTVKLLQEKGLTDEDALNQRITELETKYHDSLAVMKDLEGRMKFNKELRYHVAAYTSTKNIAQQLKAAKQPTAFEEQHRAKLTAYRAATANFKANNITKLPSPKKLESEYGDHSPIPEQQLHAAGIHVEMAGSCIVLHVCVLSALRHLYSCDFRDTVFLLIRFRTYSRQGRAGIFISEENKKSEPFSYREKVRIFMVWCG